MKTEFTIMDLAASIKNYPTSSTVRFNHKGLSIMGRIEIAEKISTILESAGRKFVSRNSGVVKNLPHDKGELLFRTLVDFYGQAAKIR